MIFDATVLWYHNSMKSRTVDRYAASTEHMVAMDRARSRASVGAQSETAAHRSYKRNIEVVKARSKAWAASNPILVKAFKMKSKLKGLVMLAGRPRPDLCEVCHQKSTTGRALHFDHDHATGEFRGWLCHRCNTALGLVGDSIDRLDALIVYLSRSRRPKLARAA